MLNNRAHFGIFDSCTVLCPYKYLPKFHIIPVTLSTKRHWSITFGSFSRPQGRAEMRDKDGTVTGYYSYAGGDGRVVYVNYVADKDGYRVLSNTGVPSASVAIEGGAVEKTAGPSAAADHDFQRVFTDFAKRIKVTL